MSLAIDLDLSFSENDLKSVLPIGLALVFFIIYWFTSKSEKVEKYFHNKYDFDKAAYKYIFFIKTFGFITLGVFPVFISLLFIQDFSLQDYGLTIIPETNSFTILWILILSVVILPLVYFSAKKPKSLKDYPQIRSRSWNAKIYFINLFGWAIYLLGYELLFRGVLLFPLVDSIGVWPAIAANTALYSATHIAKGHEETIVDIPLGVILCVLTLYSGTIWIAFFVHVFAAWTNSLTALKLHPDITYLSKKNNLPKS